MVLISIPNGRFQRTELLPYTVYRETIHLPVGYSQLCRLGTTIDKCINIEPNIPPGSLNGFPANLCAMELDPSKFLL